MPIDATRCQPQLNLVKLELGLDTSVLFWMAGWVAGWVAGGIRIKTKLSPQLGLA